MDHTLFLYNAQSNVLMILWLSYIIYEFYIETAGIIIMIQKVCLERLLKDAECGSK